METSLAMVRMKVLNKHGVHLSQNQRFHQVSFLGFEKTVHVADTYLDFRGVKKLSCTSHSGQLYQTFAFVGFSLPYS